MNDLADHLRAAGLVVVTAGDWKYRGEALPGPPDTIVCHHTATSNRTAGDLPTLDLLIRGRSDLRGPLSQLALSRSGVVHVLASGKANHAGRGRWLGQTLSTGTIGIEAEHPGGDAPWPQEQYDAYVLLCAALCRYLHVGPARVVGHKEWATPAGRKVDPTFDMAEFRRHIAQQLTPPDDQEDEMASFTFHDGDKTYWRDGGDTIHVPHDSDLEALRAVGVKSIGQLSAEMTARLVEAAQR